MDNENGCPVYDLDNCKSPELPPSCPILEITNRYLNSYTKIFCRDNFLFCSYPCTRFDCKATKLPFSQRSIASFMTRQRLKPRSILEVPILSRSKKIRQVPFSLACLSVFFNNLFFCRKGDFNATVRALESFLGLDSKNILR